MNWDQMEGKWKQYKGKAKETWGKFTDDDLDLIDGRRQYLIGKIQEHYGNAKEEAERQADEFVRSLNTDYASEPDRTTPLDDESYRTASAGKKRV